MKRYIIYSRKHMQKRLPVARTAYKQGLRGIYIDNDYAVTTNGAELLKIKLLGIENEYYKKHSEILNKKILSLDTRGVIDSKFPNYNAVIPTGGESKDVILDYAALLRDIKREKDTKNYYTFKSHHPQNKYCITITKDDTTCKIGIKTNTHFTDDGVQFVEADKPSFDIENINNFLNALKVYRGNVSGSYWAKLTISKNDFKTPLMLKIEAIDCLYLCMPVLNEQDK